MRDLLRKAISKDKHALAVAVAAAAAAVSWSAPASAGSGPLVGFVRSDNVDSVVYQSKVGGNNIMELSYSGGPNWMLNNLTVHLASIGQNCGSTFLSTALSAYVRPDHTNSVMLGITGAGAVEEYALTPGHDWSCDTEESSVGSASIPSGWARSDGVANSVFVDNHDVWTTYLNGGWQLADLSTVSGSPSNVGSGPIGWVRADGLNSVVYVGSDSHIYEILLQSGSWQRAVDLTQKTGARASSGEQISTYVRHDGVSSILFQDTIGDFSEIDLNPNGSRTWGDLTVAAGGPTLAPTGAYAVGYVRSDNTSAVVYRDTTHNHVWEISLANGRWVPNDLTQRSGAPSVGGSETDSPPPFDPYPYVRADGVNAVVFGTEKFTSKGNDDIWEISLSQGHWIANSLTVNSGN